MSLSKTDLQNTFSFRLFRLPVVCQNDVIVLNASGSISTEVKNETANPALLYVLTMSTKQSREKIVQILNQVAREFGACDLMSCRRESLNRAAVLAFKTRWEVQNKSPATINLALTVIRGVFKQMWLSEVISDREYHGVLAIRPTRGKRELRGRALTLLESSRLISDCESDGTLKRIRDAAIFAVGLGCGLRRSEIASLTNSDIHPADQSISLIGKGNKERKVFCSQDVWKRLANWIHGRDKQAGLAEPNNPLFCSIRKGDHARANELLTDDGIYRMMIRRAEQMGISDFSPHDLRRIYATRLLQMGGDINIVRQAMGHASIATTQRYDKRGEDEVRRLTSRLVF